ncbi:hypothetical protein [Synechococcus elongatus]|uniref:hypothetical protein n=1 Tax=Synechococcus elongatus TaxID=32046 RepID=UPI000039FF81|nr:hypothetical protein [Synechococcus elongatus]MBD2588751.1 hypothetical protein [Synechococcus elongatus FACHB-242]MBD2689661.1 hypothetical protein [Synechococcus elongatus FACHB-1061]MBD2708267.1 hypothetical protein [Synechococcus elongatus PCC 7942 = FACHB-805]UOW70649.1 hypothetical protein PCC7943_0888 [Synechococcus elongatus PCC 7943]UOW73370.1 hypothetical protein PCC6311_0888 [Synechococcus elongatus PCC 6311]
MDWNPDLKFDFFPSQRHRTLLKQLKRELQQSRPEPYGIRKLRARTRPQSTVIA